MPSTENAHHITSGLHAAHVGVLLQPAPTEQAALTEDHASTKGQ